MVKDQEQVLVGPGVEEAEGNAVAAGGAGGAFG